MTSDVNMLTVIFYSLIGGVVSLIGGALLLTRKSSAQALAKYATPFAAGALLGAAFLDLLPEGVASGDAEGVLTFALLGIITFFLLERFLHWFHHHHDEDSKVDPNISLVIVGDTIHNFIDGIAIAASFLISVETGIVTTLAVALHEIPQEIGDFGLLLKKGMSRNKVLWVNVFSALATTVAAVIFFAVGQNNDFPVEALMGLTAGFFIYIAASDVIPSIHEQSKHKYIIDLPSVLLIAGALIVGVVSTQLHDYIDAGHDQSTEVHEQDTKEAAKDTHDHADEHDHEDDHTH